MRRTNAKWALLPMVTAMGVLAFLGCGGSTVGNTSTNGIPDGPDGSPNAGGNTSGTGGRASGTGGRASTGGAPECGPIGCPDIGCAPGYRTVIPPGACCPTCVKDCGNVDCAFPSCPPGVMTYTPPDQCCPVCGPDCRLVDCLPPNCPPGSKLVPSPIQCCGICTPVATDASAPVCNGGMDVFLKEQIATLNALSCMTAKDCTIVELGYQCQLDCGTAVNVASAAALSSRAQTFSANNCSGCPQTNVACPPVYFTAECKSGQCVRVP